jgi:hypothetical protein
VALALAGAALRAGFVRFDTIVTILRLSTRV